MLCADCLQLGSKMRFIKKIFQRLAEFMALVALFVGFSSQYAIGQGLQCSPPVEGDWVFQSEQAKTVFGPGGAGQTGEFTLKVESCGEAIILTNFGDPAVGNPKRFERVSADPAKYLFLKTITR